MPTLFFSVGFPDHFTALCEYAAFHLAQRIHGDTALIAADTTEQLASRMIGVEASSIMAVVRRPNPRLQQLLIRDGKSCVLALGNPWSLVADMVDTQKLDLTEAVRSAANSAASIFYCAKAKDALILTDGLESSPLEIAAAIDGHFGFHLEQAEIAAVADALPKRDAGRDIKSWRQTLDAEADALIGGVLDGYSGYAATGRVREIDWDRSLFFIGDGQAERATRAVDIAGPSRCLFYGPYIALPPGSWIAYIPLVCSRETAGMELVAEVASGNSVLSRTRLTLDHAGMSEAVLDFALGEAMENAVEIRIFTARAALGGRIGLGRVALLPRLSGARDRRGKAMAEFDLDVG